MCMFVCVCVCVCVCSLGGNGRKMQIEKIERKRKMFVCMYVRVYQGAREKEEMQQRR